MKVSSCDLCGSENYLSFPQRISRPLRVVMCRSCSLIYTNPCWDETEIRAVYEKGFKDDPGAPANLLKNDSEIERAERFAKARQIARTSLVPTLCKFVAPTGKKWLDVRFRTGALAVELSEMGADVRAVDIFEANVNWLKAKLPDAEIYQTDVHNLLGTAEGKIDVISMISTHVAAHVPSPTKLFQTAFEKLTINGLLFVDEKDVTQISPTAAMFPFQYPFGMAHYHHLTLETTRAFIKKAGFEILHAAYTDKTTAQKHFLIVAQKRCEIAAAPDKLDLTQSDFLQIYSRLLQKYFQMRFRQKGRAVVKRMQKSVASRI